MKRLLILALALCLVLGLAACAKPATQDPTTPTTVPTTTPTTAPTTPPVPTSYTDEFLAHATKEGVPAFLALLGEQMPDMLIGARAVTEENCYNITTDAVAADTDAQVFQSEYGYAFILCNGKITAINRIHTMIPCDIDGNGEKDILLITSRGSGVAYYAVSVYNSVKQDITELHIACEDYSLDRLWVVASGADVYFEGKTEADNNIQYPVLSLEKVYENNKLSGYAVTGIYGSVVYQDGQYQFVPYKK